MVLEFHIGDVLELKKPHPCGSVYWEVFRIGADIGISCQGCRRKVLISRTRLERGIRNYRPRLTTTSAKSRRMR